MKFLVDNQLPQALVHYLIEQGHRASHLDDRDDDPKFDQGKTIAIAEPSSVSARPAECVSIWIQGPT